MKVNNNLFYKSAIIFMILILCSCSSSKNNASANKSNTLATESLASLTETYWRLIELNGQPIVREDNKKEIYMILKSEDNRVHGYSGCNTFNGIYSLAGENRISYSKFATTLMACIDMSKENEFMEVLEKSDNFVIKGGILSLNKARMAPLAKFESVLMK